MRLGAVLAGDVLRNKNNARLVSALPPAARAGHTLRSSPSAGEQRSNRHSTVVASSAGAAKQDRSPARGARKTRCGSSSGSPQQHFEHEVTADVGQHQHYKARKRPPQRRAATPAKYHASQQQSGEHNPGRDGKYCLVIEPQWAAEQLLRKENPADKGR